MGLSRMHLKASDLVEDVEAAKKELTSDMLNRKDCTASLLRLEGCKKAYKDLLFKIYNTSI